MLGNSQVSRPQRVGFLLLPNFSLAPVVSAIEPLRLANRQSAEELYTWEMFTVDGEPVSSSAGIALTPVRPLAEAEAIRTLVVVGGLETHAFDDRFVTSFLRRMDRLGADLGALCTGAHYLARAGLLDGYRCTVHWENIPSFEEDFPDIEVVPTLFDIDRNRFTCAGGAAALDLMLHLIEKQHGLELATIVSEQSIHERIREGADFQRMTLRSRLGISHPKLVLVIAEMEANLEEPLSRLALARNAGISTRQLERLFRRYLNRTPTRYYLELRLTRARNLLQQTSMPVIGVALACGFVSASHFSKCYREYYGHTPGDERKSRIKTAGTGA
ncbi:GlxA family transcriptional regulator [Oceanibacterium hippocampi]|uniref:HTH-type transcriptional regulator CdhR n=1 Tax=Oceanibacterium hippocampi TaxID=745714 RepID=A0A1Y5SN90_9PROT|nr:GlxA family transcriptional regulator [Oceanibacterium hippocampi]SLN43457.1 HTH-type transcriptional regulator CdhR [Oceanibacterium hippocampi]